RKKVNYDPFAYMDKAGYGLNPQYEKQWEAYNEQQVEKQKQVGEDPEARTITYAKSGKGRKKTTLKVRSFGWMEKNWSNVRGNSTFGTYATMLTVDDNPFVFRANNTKDVGLAPMTLGLGDTYVSSTFRSFRIIGSELDTFIGDDPERRKAVGKSILKALQNT